MDQIDNQDVDLVNNDGSQDSQETKVDWESDAKKAKAEAAKWKRIAERNAKKSEPEHESVSSSKEQKESSDLDYGQKALLRSMGIKGADEIQLAKDFMKRTGMDIDALESDDIFQARLEKLRTNKSNEAAADAARGGGQGSSGGRTSVEYWLAKGEHPPAELGRKLAAEYVAARRASSQNNKMFYND